MFGFFLGVFWFGSHEIRHIAVAVWGRHNHMSRTAVSTKGTNIVTVSLPVKTGSQCGVTYRGPSLREQEETEAELQSHRYPAVRVTGQWKTIPDSPPAFVVPLTPIEPHPKSSENNPCWYLQPRILYTLNSYTKNLEHLRGCTIFPPDLFQAPDGHSLEEALVTSFLPFDVAFLIDHVPKNTQLTLVIDGEPRDTPEVHKEVWSCVHPRHVDCYDDKLPSFICNICEKQKINEGESFMFCRNCRLDICMDCFKLLHEEPEISRMERLASCKSNHRIHNCDVVEKIPNQSSAKTCKCTRKRKLCIIHPPLLSGEYSIMHAKLMLLVFKTHLRIVISSFNLDEDNQLEAMSDSFWVQDFPLLDNTQNKDSNVAEIPRFIQDLSEFIELLGCAEWATKLRGLSVDYALLDPNFFLITSVPQNFNKFRSKSPLVKMRDSLKEMSLEDGLESPVLVQTFSLGGAGLRWLDDFSNALGAKLDPSSFCVVFGNATVTFDREGTLRKIGCVLTYPKDLDAHWHSKMMVRWGNYCKSCSKQHGWIYLGSHNLSRASWSGKGLWELGILWCSPMTNCNSQLDLASLTLPFPVQNLRYFSWMDCWPLTSFKNGRFNADDVIVVPGYALIAERKNNKLFCVVTIETKTSRLHLWEDKVALDYEHHLLQPPPSLGTLLHVTCLLNVDSRRLSILFVERIFTTTKQMPARENLLSDRSQWRSRGGRHGQKLDNK